VASCIGPACEAGLSIDAWKGACVTADSEQQTLKQKIVEDKRIADVTPNFSCSSFYANLFTNSINKLHICCRHTFGHNTNPKSKLIQNAYRQWLQLDQWNLSEFSRVGWSQLNHPATPSLPRSWMETTSVYCRHSHLATYQTPNHCIIQCELTTVGNACQPWGHFLLTTQSAPTVMTKWLHAVHICVKTLYLFFIFILSLSFNLSFLSSFVRIGTDTPCTDTPFSGLAVFDFRPL